MQEDSKWLNDFYQEVNAGKRMELWQKHGCTEQTEGDTFREQLLYARYGKKKKKEDTFIGYLMQMKYLSESTGVDFSGQRNHKWVISSGCRESKPGGTGDTSGRIKEYVSYIYGCE